MKVMANILLGAIILGILTLIGMSFYEPPSPLVDLGGDAIAPAAVKPLGRIEITRNFIILRSEPMRVSRRMIKGDCRTSCEIVDLPSGSLLLDPGEYRNIRRDHLIPSFVAPGEWRVLVTIYWQDQLGRELHQNLAGLKLVVLP